MPAAQPPLPVPPPPSGWDQLAAGNAGAPGRGAGGRSPEGVQSLMESSSLVHEHGIGASVPPQQHLSEEKGVSFGIGNGSFQRLASDLVKLTTAEVLQHLKKGDERPSLSTIRRNTPHTHIDEASDGLKEGNKIKSSPLSSPSKKIYSNGSYYFEEMDMNPDSPLFMKSRRIINIYSSDGEEDPSRYDEPGIHQGKRRMAAKDTTLSWSSSRGDLRAHNKVDNPEIELLEEEVEHYTDEEEELEQEDPELEHALRRHERQQRRRQQQQLPSSFLADAETSFLGGIAAGGVEEGEERDTAAATRGRRRPSLGRRGGGSFSARARRKYGSNVKKLHAEEARGRLASLSAPRRPATCSRHCPC